MRYLNGRSVTLTHTFYDDETVLTPAPVSVTAYAADGSVAYTNAGPLTPDGAGLYTASAGLLGQGVYRVVWTGLNAVDTDYVEVVGGFLFGLKEARDSDPELEDTTNFPTAELKHYREVVENEFEVITRRSFTPRTARIVIETDGTDCVWVGKFDCASLIALEDPAGTYTGLVASDYTLEANGLLSGLSGFAEGARLVATVDYGFRSVPMDVRRAGFIRLRYLLAAETSGIPDRATSYVAAEGGTFTLATPGRNGYKTGIPEVDACLNLYAYTILNDVWAAG